MLYVMNATLDDLSHHSKKVKKALKAKFHRKRLPKKFMNLVPGEGTLFGPVPGTKDDLVFHGGVLLNGRLYHALAVDLHYRNDATRHLWGSPVATEEALPSELEQSITLAELLTRCLQCGEVAGVKVYADMHCDALANHSGDGTDDRHRLLLLFEYPLFRLDEFVRVATAMLSFKPYRCATCGTRCDEDDRDVNECCQAVHPDFEDKQCGGRCTEVPFSLDEVLAPEPTASVG